MKHRCKGTVRCDANTPGASGTGLGYYVRWCRAEGTSYWPDIPGWLCWRHNREEEARAQRRAEHWDATHCKATTREGYRCARTTTYDGLCWTHYQLASLGRSAEVTPWNDHLVGVA